VLRYLLAHPTVAAARLQIGGMAGGDSGTFGDFIVGRVSRETGESMGLDGIVAGSKGAARGDARGEFKGFVPGAGMSVDHGSGDGIVAAMDNGEVNTDEEAELEADAISSAAAWAKGGNSASSLPGHFSQA